MLSADKLSKQFGPTHFVGPDLDPNCLTLLWEFLKEFFEKVDFGKNQQMTKKHMKNYL